jgi:mRNA-degrading endonuclease RelE of RelBE toxin-antitoxin system
MDIEVADAAKKDLERLPNPVRDTFYSKVESTEKNLDIGATPKQAFDKYLSGNMNPVLQMNLGRDFRAWFIEGKYIDSFNEDLIYCFKVLTKKEAKDLTDRIPDAVTFLQSLL